MIHFRKPFSIHLTNFLTKFLTKLTTFASIAIALEMLSISVAAFSADAFAFPVEVATAPENTLPLVLSVIQSAHHSLLVNIYELASPEIAQALIDQVNRGVHVEILQEGEPVGGISAAARGLHVRIAQAMQKHPGCRYVEMRKSAGRSRRFHFDHAKYIVVDQSALLLGSENYSPGGHPEPGTVGNRGWEVFVSDPQPARWFAQLFAQDSDARQPDIQNLLAEAPVSQNVATPIAPLSRVSRVNPSYNATDGQIITSPDTSLNGLVGLIQSARSTIDIEQMSFNMSWIIKQSETSGTASLSPLADAIITAARRGVRVRILLNDEYAFTGGHGLGDETDGNGPEAFAETLSDAYGSNSYAMGQAVKTTTNRKTVAALMQIAQSQHLPIEARIADLKAMGVAYIHNKGMIIDQRTTLISSINWTQNSIQSNREAALAITSPQVAAYFGHAYEQDWTRSGGSQFYFAHSTQSLESKAAMGRTTDVVTACPNEALLSAQIGPIKAADGLDPSYLGLQQQTLSGDFIRDAHAKRCILLGPENLVLELRNDMTTGLLSADLEGYTSTYKPFAVEAELPTSILAPGGSASARAQVIEGSPRGGGRKRHLGAAVLNVQTH
jgi:phosphatidylserine/phosphatidylglycerophosphate/cardiolipin synthase-like enzyme